MGILLGIIVCIVLIVIAIGSMFSKPNKEKRTEEIYGIINPMMICPHCQTRGKVRAKQVVKKGGVSGTKVMAALCTVGTSLLVTGLAKKDQFTQANCGECKNIWLF